MPPFRGSVDKGSRRWLARARGQRRGEWGEAAPAPVTIVTFEDFHHPHGKRVQGTFADLESRDGDKVKVGEGARKAHEARRALERPDP